MSDRGAASEKEQVSLPPEESRQQERYRLAVEDSPNAILAVDAAGHVLMCNASCAGVIGAAGADVVGQSLAQLLHASESAARVEALVQRVFAGETISNVDLVFRDAQGAPCHMLARLYPVRAAEGAVHECIVACTDITKRKQAEEGRAASEARLRAILDNTPEAFMLLGRDLCVRVVNEAMQERACKLIGRPLRLGEPVSGTMQGESLEAFTTNARQALAGELVRVEHKVETANGGSWFEMIYAPVWEEGEVVGICFSSRDIAERKEVELELRRREERLRQQNRVLLDLAQHQVADPEDFNKAVRYITEAVTHTLDVASCSIWLFNEARTRVRCMDLYRRVQDQHLTDIELKVRDFSSCLDLLGSERVVAFPDPQQTASLHGLHVYLRENNVTSVLSAPIRQGRRLVGILCLQQTSTERTWQTDEEQFIGSAADLVALALEATHRRRTEQALHQSQQKYRDVVESVSDIIFETDAEGNITFLNPAWERLLGFSVAETLGQHVTAFVHPDKRTDVQQAFGRLAERGEMRCRLRMRRQAEEDAFRWMETRARSFADEAGQMAGVRGTLVDITEHVERQRELIRSKEKAEEMNRLKTAFLANMSHEVRTPLTAIIGFAEVLSEEVVEEHRELVNVIRTSGARLMETLNSLLNLAQLEGRALRLEPEHIDLCLFMQDCLQLFRLQAEQKGVELLLQVPDDHPIEAYLDRSALGRILTNLVSNALKFTPEGHVKVVLEADQTHIMLQVEDTGVGISADFMRHLFEEFKQESTGMDRPFEGSGLGLAISKRLVDLMGGTITARSEKGKGSTFCVLLPRQAADAENE